MFKCAAGGVPALCCVGWCVNSACAWHVVCLPSVGGDVWELLGSPLTNCVGGNEYIPQSCKSTKILVLYINFVPFTCTYIKHYM